VSNRRSATSSITTGTIVRDHVIAEVVVPFPPA
jgi:hypothetical protein